MHNNKNNSSQKIIDLIKTAPLFLSHTFAVVSHLIHPGPRRGGSLKNPQATRNFSRKSLQSLARWWSANSTQLSNHFSQPISRRSCCFIYSGTRFVTFPPDYRSPPSLPSQTLKYSTLPLSLLPFSLTLPFEILPSLEESWKNLRGEEIKGGEKYVDRSWKLVHRSCSKD